MTDTITTPTTTPDTTPGTLPVDEPDTFYTDAVARGIDLLDRHIPGWAGLIDLDELDIESCNHCILGQVARETGVDSEYLGRFGAMLDRLDLHGRAVDEHGFDAPYDGRKDGTGYSTLTALWANEVAARQARE